MKMLKVHVEMISAALRDRKGIAAMEYAILAAAILGGIGVAFTTIGGDLSTILGKVTTALAAYTS
jgi:Flp pilus assembly pilin Flp